MNVVYSTVKSKGLSWSNLQASQDEFSFCRFWSPDLNGRCTDIVLFLSSSAEAEVMFAELNEAGKRIEVWINRTKTQFVEDVYRKGERIRLEGSKFIETSSLVYLGRSGPVRISRRERWGRLAGRANHTFRLLPDDRPGKTYTYGMPSHVD